MKIRWAVRARRNLREIHQYIAQDSPENATRFVTKLFDSVEKLVDQPRIGRALQEAEGNDTIRELIFRKYRIIYLIETDCIYIVNVVHGSQDLKRLKIKPWIENHRPD